MAANIVITGFMGTGKSSVGRTVAEHLNREFVDMDLHIEETAGCSIAEIFATRGEPSFRAMERELVQKLSTRSDLVIATGGGALVDPTNRELMGRSGSLFCLQCHICELLRRLERAEDRPLLDTVDRRSGIEALLARRRDAYAQIPYQIETTGKTVDQVVEEVILLATGRQPMAVRTPTGHYSIFLAEGVSARVGEILADWGHPSGVALVSNSTVWSLHGSQVQAGLRLAGYDPLVCLVPDGEAHKRLDTVGKLYDQFIEAGLDRSGVVIALGGGVLGDMAGFAAATYMRGLPLVQVPTTLLSMIDSSVGGKVAVDHPRGKNLIGAFKQPAFVVVDPAVLDTLPDEEMRSGWAEIVKHGVISDPSLFQRLEAGPELRPSAADLVEIIASAIQVKVDIVEEDPFERGRRRVLNLGHTFAHALEVLGGFELRHGHAVGLGMITAARVASEMGLCCSRLPRRIQALLQRFGLPTQLPSYQPEAVWQAMTLDKKKRGTQLRFVLPRALGDVIITEDVPRETVLSVLRCSRL